MTSATRTAATTAPGPVVAPGSAARLTATTAATPATTRAAPANSWACIARPSRRASTASATTSPRAITDWTTITEPRASATACRARAAAPMRPPSSQRRSVTSRRSRCSGPVPTDGTLDAAARCRFVVSAKSPAAASAVKVDTTITASPLDRPIG